MPPTSAPLPAPPTALPSWERASPHWPIASVPASSRARRSPSAPGTYTVTVRDANGCTATDTIDILPPLGLTPQATVQPSCALNDGEIAITANGGSGSYEYDLLDGVGTSVTAGARQASNVFAGLAPDNYTAIVYDTRLGMRRTGAGRP